MIRAVFYSSTMLALTSIREAERLAAGNLNRQATERLEVALVAVARAIGFGDREVAAVKAMCEARRSRGVSEYDAAVADRSITEEQP